MQNTKENVQNDKEYFIQEVEKYASITQQIESLKSVDEQLNAAHATFLDITESGGLSQEQYADLQELSNVIQAIEIEHIPENEEQIMKRNILKYVMEEYVYEQDLDKEVSFIVGDKTFSCRLGEIYENYQIFSDFREIKLKESILSSIRHAVFTININTDVLPNPVTQGVANLHIDWKRIEEEGSSNGGEGVTIVETSIFDNDRETIPDMIEEHNNYQGNSISNPFYNFYFPGEWNALFFSDQELMDKRDEMLSNSWRHIELYNLQWKIVARQNFTFDNFEYDNETVTSPFSANGKIDIPSGLPIWIYIFKLSGTEINWKIVVAD